MSARPDLMEQYVAAEGAAPIVAAMGAACAKIAAGDQDERIPLVAAVLVPKAKPEHEIAAELCPLLWRLQTSADGLERAVLLFAQWMTFQRRMADFAPTPAYVSRLVPFAARVIHEWLSCRCGRCGGSGKLQVLRSGVVVRTRGDNARNVRFAACDQCYGTGQSVMAPAEQAIALGVGRKVYDQARWDRHFRAARVWLMYRLLPRPRRHLRRELERL